MKKGDRPNPGEEFLFKLSLKENFQRDLINARKHLGIPEKGSTGESDRQKWLANHDVFDLLAVELELQKRYKISVAYQEFLDDYIFFGKLKSKVTTKKPPVAIIDQFSHKFDSGNIEEFYRETGEPYVKVLIFGWGSKNDVVEFIKNNWKTIEGALWEQRGGHGREIIRKTCKQRKNPAH